MPVTPPLPNFSETDKRLLTLLGKLLLERGSQSPDSSNIDPDKVILSDEEARELAHLIDKTINSKEFLEGVYFSEGLSYGENDNRLREIYLSNRKRHGRSRALASVHWADFKRRLGIYNVDDRLVRAQPMEFNYFLKLEERLLKSSGLPRDVAEDIVDYIAAHRDEIDAARLGEQPLSRGVIQREILQPLARQLSRPDRVALREVTTRKLMSAAVLIADAGVLFTTRDWGVAGTISTMAGAVVGINRH